MPSFNCKCPTCPAILPARGYCPRHQHRAEQDAADRHRRYDQTHRDPDAKRFYDSAEWKRARVLKLATCPWCEVCRRQWAKHVHHIIELANCTQEQKTAQDNLQSCCPGCHSRIEARRRASRRRGQPCT